VSWLYLNARENVLINVLFHPAVNASMGAFGACFP
jgi:hypothetical protein